MNSHDPEKRPYAEVAVQSPAPGTFSYAVPESLVKSLAIGVRVAVPFGRRTATGFFLGFTSNRGPVEVKPVMDILDERPVFDKDRLGFYRWLSNYYFAPLGLVLAMAAAGSTLKQKRTISATDAGRTSLSELKGLDNEIVTLALRKIGLDSLERRFKGAPVLNAVASLKKRGFISVDVSFGNMEKSIVVAHLIEGACLPKPALQAKVFEYLKSNGDSPLTQLCAHLGSGAGGALRRLEDKGLVTLTKTAQRRDPFVDITVKSAPFEPNTEQKAAIGAISASLEQKDFAPFLLYGVTGSGKTLVYLKALEEAVRLKKRALYLSPEISLTPWPAAYLAGLFPGRVAIQHSGLGDGERHDEWGRIMNDEADVVVGARSALFSPIKDLGLIIVDEEHEGAYKQEDGPIRYNARDCAIMLAKTLGITVVLGSATPSLESFHNASSGKLRLLRLNSRVMDRPLPDVALIDMRSRKGEAISAELKDELAKTLDTKEQSLLLLNRRGSAGAILCRDCGHRFLCVNCAVSLTLHRHKSRLLCHYCGFFIPAPHECPVCVSTRFIEAGAGTERVEDDLRTLFKEATIARMDRDTTSKKGSVKSIIEAVEDKKTDILIGTQMVSKGHHFPGVTLAGIISGDTSLNIPDFRSAERTFQLITQAAGRAGRGETPGRVLIQTFDPEHFCFTSAIRHDYEAFYNEELIARKDAGYPPFSRLCALRLDATSTDKLGVAAQKLKSSSERLLRDKTTGGISVLGPAPALLSRLKGRHRMNMLVKSKDVSRLHRFVSALIASFDAKKHPGVSVTVDMDPSMAV